MGRLPVLGALLAVAVATAATFWPVTGHAFLNWDDPDVVTANEAFAQPWPSFVAWAFTTRHMGHYQPLSWLVLKAAGGATASPAVVHGLALALHVVCAVLLVVLIARVLDHRVRPNERRWIAGVAAATFALHPLRVEPVAWASALPYLISFSALLGAALAWLAWLRSDARAHRWAAVALFAVSQLARPTAPLAFVVLMLLGLEVTGARRRTMRELAAALWPLALVAMLLAAMEASARDVESLADIGLGQRIAWVLTNPALYLWRTVVPFGLSPLDVIPRGASPNWTAALLAVAAAAGIVGTTWRVWGRSIAVAVWGSYLCLLAPVVGLLPSGLQATADRYVYGPGLVLAVGLGLLVSRVPPQARRGALVAVGMVALVLTGPARTQLAYWRDSATLWTRAIALDPSNDVALYNLALAELDRGRRDQAVAHLERLVALVPDHAPGLAALGPLLADRAEAAAAAHATAGRFGDAVVEYGRAIAADQSRVRARLGRGMALVELGRVDEAAPDLEAVVAAGTDDPRVASALAYAWSSIGRAADAVALLQRALARQPDDHDLAGNLARLLLTAEPPALRDPQRALALASRLNDATGGNDPRVLDTLALALAATGRRADARAAWAVAITIARERGDAALAAELERHRRAAP